MATIQAQIQALLAVAEGIDGERGTTESNM